MGMPNVSRKKEVMLPIEVALSKKTLGTPFNLLIRRMNIDPLIIPHP